MRERERQLKTADAAERLPNGMGHSTQSSPAPFLLVSYRKIFSLQETFRFRINLRKEFFVDFLWWLIMNILRRHEDSGNFKEHRKYEFLTENI